ncbi:hypothetical protein DAEQUDRAFT_723258 [Daedalea quercina L-15889]|uniref:Uncharacterized protein n=1 Tax=Daedalea quercina L-15889 TaxID=1314783 RepID=A0A165SJL6_9APHY|nr:hypothetical protein DAEQUDRAFT_723258 [Daedalea quercina L-15889]
MIVDPSSTKMIAPSEDDMQAPPSYDETMKAAAKTGPFVAEGATTAGQGKVPPRAPQPYSPGPSPRGPSMPATTVYNYVNPATGEHIASLLPPDHPQMICLQQGGHVPSTRYGILGIIAAIIWFPLGVGCCLLDRRVKCARCGLTLDEGICA